MEKDFEVVKDGTTLTITLGDELSIANASALKGELAKYYGQGIDKVVFDASGLMYLSSAGIQAVIYANQRLGSKAEIVFVNCPPLCHHDSRQGCWWRFVRFLHSR